MLRGGLRTLAILLAGVLLAGCADDVAPAAVAPSPEPMLVTDVNDIESLSNESFQMAEHLHDYWGGADRLTIIDVQDAPAGAFWFGGAYLQDFVPEDGVVVPQGTARVEITLTWAYDSGETTVRQPELWLKTAADSETQLIGPAESGAVVEVPVTLAQADLPHQGISGWRAQWRLQPNMVPAGDAPGMLWTGTVSLRMDAIRGSEIPIYPPHPDLWSGAESIPLFEDAVPLSWWMGSSEPGGWACFLECPWIHRPVNGTVVPYDAAAVEVTLAAGGETPLTIGLKLHGADTWTWSDAEATQTEGNTQVFVIPVEPGKGDSPYASQSVWEFAIYSAEPRDQMVMGSYTMSARALRAL